MFRLVIFFFLLFYFLPSRSEIIECKRDYKKNKTPCITIRATPNTSFYSSEGVNKKIISRQDIINSGAIDINDLLKLVPGLDVFQDGPLGQKTSIFTRGSESNHTLVLLNGIPINDQSVTDGLYDFGQDFVQTIHQIEIYKGASGAHFGPSAIAGAVNLITAIDYTNNLAVSGFNGNNSSLEGNYTKIIDNGWHLNFKGATTQSKTNSAKADGFEKDASKNIQGNINAEKWINDNLKFRSTLYSRKTKSGYDDSATEEIGYVVDNKMYAFQTGLDHFLTNTEDTLTFHYHNYDRDYQNGGYLDEFESESLIAKGERKIKSTDKLSFGYGFEYKYDWGAFENRGSYSQSTKGHMKNLGFFGNTGFKLTENSILSFYGRTDDHNTTGKNQTYKLNFIQTIKKFKFGATHSTGLRNPTLYEFYGSNNYGYKGNTNLNPEKSKTNEINAIYNFSDNLSFNLTAYKATIFDRIEDNETYTASENKIVDLNQEGLEPELLYKGNNQSLSIFGNFSKSRKTNGQAQLRRPDITYGSNYTKKFLTDFIGPFNLNLNYKFTGQHIDTDGNNNIRVKSTDIINVSLSKNFLGNIFSLNISNLLNERYERPVTYSQEGRQIRFGFRKLY